MNKRPTWETGEYDATTKRRSYRLTSLEALRATMLAQGVRRRRSDHQPPCAWTPKNCIR